MATGGFELRDHTADIALFAWGPTYEALFRAAVDGLYATIGDVVTEGGVREETLAIEASDGESLLQDLLSELLFRFETAGEVLKEVEFRKLSQSNLDALMKVANVDRGASVFDREVKAVTYHDIRIEHNSDRYEVTVILDI